MTGPASSTGRMWCQVVGLGAGVRRWFFIRKCAGRNRDKSAAQPSEEPSLSAEIPADRDRGRRGAPGSLRAEPSRQGRPGAWAALRLGPGFSHSCVPRGPHKPQPSLPFLPGPCLQSRHCPDGRWPSGRLLPTPGEVPTPDRASSGPSRRGQFDLCICRCITPPQRSWVTLLSPHSLGDPEFAFINPSLPSLSLLPPPPPQPVCLSSDLWTFLFFLIQHSLFYI